MSSALTPSAALFPKRPPYGEVWHVCPTCAPVLSYGFSASDPSVGLLQNATSLAAAVCISCSSLKTRGVKNWYIATINDLLLLRKLTGEARIWWQRKIDDAAKRGFSDSRDHAIRKHNHCTRTFAKINDLLSQNGEDPMRKPTTTATTTTGAVGGDAMTTSTTSNAWVVTKTNSAGGTDHVIGPGDTVPGGPGGTTPKPKTKTKTKTKPSVQDTFYTKQECSCTITDLGDPERPPTVEKDPFCPTHGDPVEIRKTVDPLIPVVQGTVSTLRMLNGKLFEIEAWAQNSKAANEPLDHMELINRISQIRTEVLDLLEDDALEEAQRIFKAKRPEDRLASAVRDYKSHSTAPQTLEDLSDATLMLLAREALYTSRNELIPAIKWLRTVAPKTEDGKQMPVTQAKKLIERAAVATL